MNPVSLDSMTKWASIAHLPFIDPKLQWLEALNPANVLYYRWFYYVIRRLQPAVALELGISRAQGSAHLAAAGPKVTIGIDRAPWGSIYEQNIAEIRRRGYDYRFIHANTLDPESQAQVRQIVGETGPLELLFIDSTHLAWHAKAEWELYRDMIPSGAIVVMDDIRAPAEMYQAFLEIPGQHIEFPNLHIADRGSVGFGAIIYDGEDTNA